MTFACLLGAHKWYGCMCLTCSKQRDQGHNWIGCKCTRCATVREQDHNWYRDCEHCSRCGAARQNKHRWEGCQCILCYGTRDEQHDWSRNCQYCARCGKNRATEHVWAGCHCQLCTTTRDEEHSYQGCRCAACGKIRDEGHNWAQDCQRCSACGRTRMSGHMWAGEDEPCVLCKMENPDRSFHQGNSYYLAVLESQTAAEANLVATQAMAAYEMAAAAGHPLAMNMLAVLLVETDGNLERARQWLITASETGIREITENLLNLRRYMRPTGNYARASFNYTWGNRPPRKGSMPVGTIRPMPELRYSSER